MLDKYPYLSDRYKSMGIDGFLLLGLMFLFGIILDYFGIMSGDIRILLLGVLILYELLCMAFLGTTLGNSSMKLKVRRFDNNNLKPGIFQSLWRYVLKLGLGWISFLTVHSNKERRAIHDFLAGTVVLYTNPAEIAEETTPEITSSVEPD